MADYDGVITELKAKRATLQEEMAEIDTVLGTLEKMMSHNDVRAQEAQPYRALGLVDAARKALELAGRRRGTTELLTELKTGGFKSHAKDPYISLYRALLRLSKPGGPVVKLKEGWALRKWQSHPPASSVQRAA